MNKIDWIVALSEKTEKVVKKIQNKTKCRLSKELKKIGTVAQFNTKTSVRGIRSLKVKKNKLKKIKFIHYREPKSSSFIYNNFFVRH